MCATKDILIQAPPSSNLQTPVPNSGQAPAAIFAVVQARLATGSPFTHASAAWAGYEEIGQLNGWQIGLNFAASILSLKANKETQALPLLPVATRRGKNDYEIILDQATFEHWIAPLVPPAPGQVLYDLVIASRKYGVGSTSQPDAPILWWKTSGQPKEKPGKRVSLIHPLIQKRLAGYELVDTEVQVNQVIRKYRKVEVQNA